MNLILFLQFYTGNQNNLNRNTQKSKIQIDKPTEPQKNNDIDMKQKLDRTRCVHLEAKKNFIIFPTLHFPSNQTV